MGVWIWPTWWHQWQWHCLVLALAGTMRAALASQVVIMTSQLGIDQSAQRSMPVFVPVKERIHIVFG